MALKKICPKCHKIIDAGKTYCNQCTLKRETEKKDNNRHYDKYLRNKQSTEFYHSGEWISLRSVVLGIYKGLDIYDYYTNNKIAYAEMVHHIIELDSDWNRRLDITNLIPLTNKNHNTIGALYLKDKARTQIMLFDLLRRWNKEMLGELGMRNFSSIDFKEKQGG